MVSIFYIFVIELLFKNIIPIFFYCSVISLSWIKAKMVLDIPKRKAKFPFEIMLEDFRNDRVITRHKPTEFLS